MRAIIPDAARASWSFVELVGQLIYFVGPSPARPGQVIGSAGPTTSGRMNPFLPTFLARGLRGFMGKGYLGQAVKEALVAHHGVYFGAIGGTGALLSGCIESAQVVAFPELVSEAIHLLRLRCFPAVVLYDTQGGDLYAHVSPQTGSADGTGSVLEDEGKRPMMAAPQTQDGFPREWRRSACSVTCSCLKVETVRHDHSSRLAMERRAPLTVETL